ncbi:hypothetical protein ACFQ60_37875 [Streptomyces zhihengii]
MALAVPYVLVTLFVVRPLLRRVFVRNGEAVPFAPWHVALVLIGVLLSAAATEAMGMHFIFGAFLFGTIMPRRRPSSCATRSRTGWGRSPPCCCPSTSWWPGSRSTSAP